MRQEKAQVMGIYWYPIACCIAGIAISGLRLSAMFCVTVATILLLGGIGRLVFDGRGANVIATSIGAPAILVISFFVSGWVFSTFRKTDRN